MNWQKYLLGIILFLWAGNIWGQNNAIKGGLFVYSWRLKSVNLSYERYLKHGFSLQASFAGMKEPKHDHYRMYFMLQPRYYFYLTERKQLEGFYLCPMVGGSYFYYGGWFPPPDSELKEVRGILAIGLGFQYQIWKGFTADVNFFYPAISFETYLNVGKIELNRTQGTFISLISLGYAF